MHLFLVTVGITFLVPLAWLVSSSLKGPGDQFAFPPKWIPGPVHFENYVLAVTLLPFGTFFKNTVMICALNLIGTLISSSLTAFAFARLRFPGRDRLFVILLSTMMLPGIVTLIPTFVMFKQLGWVDTIAPLTVPAFFGGGAFNIFLIRQFYMTIPADLDEAARMDGANSWRIWRQIMLPLTKPALGTVGIFNFLSHWNDFMGPLIYLRSTENYTLALGVAGYQRTWGAEWHLVFASASLMVFPVIIVFFLGQRYFVQGIALTGMGGK
ncbi:MAG: carbohydrate ABC transporter permease [Anaerolineae bacterium]|nr:carbohydrate ABC transporter permease [Anaerolineae bacterium]